MSENYSNVITEEDSKTKFFFPVEQIPRLSVFDPLAEELILQEKPVVIHDSNLCSTALKWTLPYLTEHLGIEKCSVFSSPNHIFKYFDQTKINQYVPDFIPPIQKIEISIQEFVNMLLDWKPGGKRIYLQQLLSNAVGPVIVKDFLNFNWSWLKMQQKIHNWGALTSNLLLIAMEGA